MTTENPLLKTLRRMLLDGDGPFSPKKRSLAVFLPELEPILRDIADKDTKLSYIEGYQLYLILKTLLFLKEEVELLSDTWCDDWQTQSEHSKKSYLGSSNKKLIDVSYRSLDELRCNSNDSHIHLVELSSRIGIYQDLEYEYEVNFVVFSDEIIVLLDDEGDLNSLRYPNEEELSISLIEKTINLLWECIEKSSLDGIFNINNLTLNSSFWIDRLNVSPCWDDQILFEHTFTKEYSDTRDINIDFYYDDVWVDHISESIKLADPEGLLHQLLHIPREGCLNYKCPDFGDLLVFHNAMTTLANGDILISLPIRVIFWIGKDRKDSISWVNQWIVKIPSNFTITDSLLEALNAGIRYS